MASRGRRARRGKQNRDQHNAVDATGPVEDSAGRNSTSPSPQVTAPPATADAVDRLAQAVIGARAPWYESNLLWGTLSLGIGIVLTVLGTKRWLLIIAWLCFCLFGVFLRKLPWARRHNRFWNVGWPIFCGVALLVLYLSLGPSEVHPPISAQTAVFMECTMVPLPISIPAGGSIRIIPLNRAQLRTQAWGFFEVGGDGRKQWPEEGMLKKSRALHNYPAMFAYKCTVSNHGSSNLIYIEVPIDMWFGDRGGEQNRFRYVPVISALDSGRESDFYLVNDCQTGVSAAWQATARVQIVGEPGHHEVPLRRTYRSPLDQLMMLFPTKVRWLNAHPTCD